MHTGLKKFRTASFITFLLLIQLLVVIVPAASASSHHPPYCALTNGGSCDEWQAADDQTPDSQTWINAQYDFHMVDTSQVQLEMVWAIHEFDRSALGPALNALDFGAGSSSATDGIPADYIRNYIDEDAGGGTTVGDELLAEAEGIITNMLDSGFGTGTQASASFTNTAQVGGSYIACESDPDKDSNSEIASNPVDAFMPALCLQISATVELASSAVAIAPGVSDLERAYRGMLIMGAEISTGFTLQSPAGHDSNFKILPPSYAQVVSATPAYGVPSTDYATWAVDSKALAQTAPDLTQEITMRMKYREDASTPVVSYDTSTEKGVDIQVVLDMQDEYNAELSVEVGIYYIDAATMSNWGINLLDISSDASIPLVTADGVRLAKHNGLIDEDLLKNSFPKDAIAAGINAMLDGDPVAMEDMVVEATHKDGGMDFVHNVHAQGSCNEISTIGSPKYYCINGDYAMSGIHPIYLTTKSNKFQFALLDMMKDLIGDLSGDITEDGLNALNTGDLQAIFNAGLSVEVDLGDSFLSGFMPSGIPPTDLTVTILLPTNPQNGQTWVAGFEGSDRIILKDSFSEEDLTRIRLQGSNLYDWSHPIPANAEPGEEICTMDQKTCTTMLIDFNMADFSINEWSQSLTLEVAASFTFEFYRVEVPPAVSDFLTSDDADIDMDVIPADLIHLIVDIGDRMEEPFGTTVDVGDESYELTFSRTGINTFATFLGDAATELLHGLGDEITEVDIDLSGINIEVDIGEIPVPDPNDVTDMNPVSISVNIPKTVFTLKVDVEKQTAAIDTTSAIQAPLANLMSKLTNALSVNAGGDGILFDNGGTDFKAEMENPGLEIEELDTSPQLTLDLKLPKGLEVNFKSSAGNAELPGYTEDGQQRIIYTFPKSGETDNVEFSFKISWWFIISEIWAYIAIPILLIGLLIYKRRQKKKRKRAMKNNLINKEYAHSSFEKEVPDFGGEPLESGDYYNANPESWTAEPKTAPPPPSSDAQPRLPPMPSSPYGGRSKSFEDMLGWK